MKRVIIIRFILISLLYFMFIGCSKRIDVEIPDQNSLDAVEAYKIVTETVIKYSPVKELQYKEMVSSSDSTRVVHVWENTKNRAYYIRYWSFDGNDLRVEFQTNSSSSEYYVALRNNGADPGDCYGYSHSLPVSKGMRFDIYWSDAAKQGCKIVIRYSFKDKEEALLFAGALQYMFIDHKVEDVLYDINNPDAKISETLNEKKITEKKSVEDGKGKAIEDKSLSAPVKIGNSSCTVNKILQMQQIGLSTDEIKKICK